MPRESFLNALSSSPANRQRFQESPPLLVGSPFLSPPTPTEQMSMKNAYWDAEQVFKSFCFRLVRDESTAHLSPFLFGEERSSEFMEVLQSGAREPSPESATEFVRQWLYYLRDWKVANFPAPQLWSLLSPLLEQELSPLSTPPFASPEQSPFSLPVEQREESLDLATLGEEEDLSFLPIEAQSCPEESESDPYEQCACTILNLLSCSPLLIWLDINALALQLQEELPRWTARGVLDLQPLWQELSGLPGVQQEAVAAFFAELCRQPFSWPAHLPTALSPTTPPPSTSPTQKLRSKESPLSTRHTQEFFSEEKRTQELRTKEFRTPKPSREEARTKKPRPDETRSKEFRTKEFRTKEFRTKEFRSPKPSIEEEAPRGSCFQEHRTERFRTKEFRFQELHTREARAEHTPKALTPIQRPPSPLPPSAPPQSPGKKSETEDLHLCFSDVTWLDRQFRVPIGETEEAISTIFGVLLASPLALWVDVGSFQSYLQRRLPEYTQRGLFDLQPLWENVKTIPGTQSDAIEIFFDELSRQPLPWKVCLPASLETPERLQLEFVVARQELETRQQASRASSLPSTTASSATTAQEKEGPRPYAVSPSDIDENEMFSVDDLLAEFNEKELEQIEVVLGDDQGADEAEASFYLQELLRSGYSSPDLSPDLVELIGEPQPASSAPSLEQGTLRLTWREVSRRTLLLGGVLLLLCLALGAHTWLRPLVQRRALNATPYQKYLPLQRVYKHKQTLSFYLRPSWQKRISPASLSRRIHRSKRELFPRQIRHLRLFSPEGRLLFVVDF